MKRVYLLLGITLTVGAALCLLGGRFFVEGDRATQIRIPNFSRRSSSTRTVRIDD